MFSFFGSKGIKFYPVILIRQDILDSLNLVDSSFNKIISSNTLRFNWYSQAQFHSDPEKVPLKRMISERVRHAYKIQNKPCPEKPWESILLGNDVFKWVLDGTLYRPRDLIQLFSLMRDAHPDQGTINSEEYTRIYRNEFSLFLIREWENELMAFLNATEIKVTLSALRSTDSEVFKFDAFKKSLSKMGVQNPDKILSLIYKAGMISNVVEENGVRKYNWIYRSENPDNDFIDYDGSLIAHRCIKRTGFFSR